MAVVTTTAPGRPAPSRAARNETITFYLCISPWILGLFLFTLLPMAAALYLSFTSWNVFTAPRWVGFDNYVFALTGDPDFWTSLRVTGFYAIFSIPLRLATALGLAILLNEATRGVSFFRTAFYLPAIVASVAATVLWTWILNPVYGPVNGLIGLFGVQGPNWFTDPAWVPWAMIIMSVWNVGGEMLIFLAALKGIPGHLYEAAELDGANRLIRFFNVTLPMISATMFFNLVMSIIGTFQTFDAAYIVGTARAGTLGGPADSTLFYMIYTYDQAYGQQAMGYASALGWILLVITLVVTWVVNRSSSLWVYSEAERGK
jgi:multiple sugar transport system permease protein